MLLLSVITMQCKENWSMWLLLNDQRWWKVIIYNEVLIIKFSVLLNLKGYSAKGGIFFWFLANNLVVFFLCVNYLIWFCQSECQHILNRVISMAQSRLFCFLRFLLTDNRNLPINNIKTWSQRFLSLKIKKTIQDN